MAMSRLKSDRTETDLVPGTVAFFGSGHNRIWITGRGALFKSMTLKVSRDRCCSLHRNNFNSRWELARYFSVAEGVAVLGLKGVETEMFSDSDTFVSHPYLSAAS